jgi:V-type H+-transporting ATPase subunit d
LPCSTWFSPLIDLKIHLATTDYGNFLSNEPSPIPVSVIDEKLKQKISEEFFHIRRQTVQPLSKFLDFITYVFIPGEKGH